MDSSLQPSHPFPPPQSSHPFPPLPPPQTYLHALKKARDSFMSGAIRKEESLGLEQVIRGERLTTLKWPPILNWAPEIIKKKRLILTCIVGGVLIATISIPQSMAFCAMIGVGVGFGVYSSTLPMILYGVLGTSKQMTIGPAATTYMMIRESLEGKGGGGKEIYAQNIGFLMGIYMIGMGMLKCGFIENIFSQPIMSGYLVATGVLIIIDQLPQVFVIPMKGRIWNKMYDFFSQLGDTNIYSLTIAVVSFGVFYFVHYLKYKYYPKSLLLSCIFLYVTVFVSLLTYIFDWKTTLGLIMPSKVPSSFPPFNVSFLDPSIIAETWSEALKIALVGYIGTLLISKQLAKKYDYPIDATYEFYSLGLSNLLGSVFSALPAFASLVRGPIIEITEAKSQLCGMITGLTVLILTVSASFLLEMIPITVISSFVIYSCSLSLVDLGELPFLARNFPLDFFFFMLSFVGCLLLGLADGLLLSIVLSMLMVLKYSSKSIWSFHTFTNDEENLPESRREESPKRKRLNTQNMMEELNEKTVSPWILNLRRLSAMSEGKGMDANAITAFDLCLCHDLHCPRRCHIMVINFYGYLNYYNVKSLKENADFLSIALEEQKDPPKKKEVTPTTATTVTPRKNNISIIMEVKEEENNTSPLIINQPKKEQKEPKDSQTKEEIEKKRGGTIRGIILDFSRLEDVDYTAVKTLKAFVAEMKGKKPIIFVKFSDVYQEVVRKKLKAGRFANEVVKHCERDCMSVLFKMSADILKRENEIFKNV